MMIKRELILPKERSIFLFGPRQTGKSTLLQASFKPQESLYYDLLKFDEYRRFTARPSLFREEVSSRNKAVRYIIVDEVQRIPELLDEVHYLMHNQPGLVFCLSGSSARKLKRGRANLLAGRAWVYHLYPLTYRELGSAFSLSKAMRIGALPGIYPEKNEDDARLSLKAYCHTYLKEEIEIEAAVRNVSGFLRFLPLAATENGNVLNYSNIARETGTSYKTVREYFRILEDTLIGFLLFPYSRSPRKQVVKHPKFYFFDLGVRRALAGRLSLSLEPGSSDYGRAFEHFFITELIRGLDYRQRDYRLSFYRTEAGAEVDIILESSQGKTYAVEIKSGADPSPAALSGLRSFRRIVPGAKGLCACLAPRPRRREDIEILPWQEALQFLLEQ